MPSPIIRFFTMCFLITVAISCSKDLPAPGLPEKLKVLTASKKDCACDPYIDLYKWRGQFVYVLEYNGPTCDWEPALYDINGETFHYPATQDYGDFHEGRKFIRREWTCVK